MSSAARAGDLIKGGDHCHGHGHGPQPAPGRIIRGSTKVFIDGKPAARVGDEGYSAVCCGNLGQIKIVSSSSKIRIDGLPAATTGSATVHCGMGAGFVAGGSKKVRLG